MRAQIKLIQWQRLVILSLLLIGLVQYHEIEHLSAISSFKASAKIEETKIWNSLMRVETNTQDVIEAAAHLPAVGPVRG